MGIIHVHSEQQFNCKQFIDKGIGYAMEIAQIDGNKDEVYWVIREIKEKQKKNRNLFL